MRLLWVEYDATCALPHIQGDAFKIHIEHKENQRLFQFLIGLNEKFSGVRSHLLLWDPPPSVNQAYNLLIQEESQKGFTSTVLAYVGPFSDNTLLNVDKGRVNQYRECAVCKKKGHAIERCFSKGCDFCKKKRYVKDNCFKYKEFLNPQTKHC